MSVPEIMLTIKSPRALGAWGSVADGTFAISAPKTSEWQVLIALQNNFNKTLGPNADN